MNLIRVHLSIPFIRVQYNTNAFILFALNTKNILLYNLSLKY
jgi:hypothetical protein